MSTSAKNIHHHRALSRSLLTRDQVEVIRDLVSTQKLSRAGVIGNNKSLARTCRQIWLREDHRTNWLYQIIKDLIDEAADNFGFEIGHIEMAQYLDYHPFEYYLKHVDNGDDNVAHRKLTASIQLSSPREYIGGNFKIDTLPDVTVANKNLGSVIVFPSFLQHSAGPVWIGSRKALVVWARGTNTLH